jgi:predicted 3-demethylubiquinone-9 3-methyltransferase (glyoxalase superfamily)
VTFYVDMDDLAAYRKRIMAEGGKIHLEEQEVPGMGACTLFTDPKRPHFKFTEAISLFVNCETRQEVDQLRERLSEAGQKEQCG